MIKKRKDDLMSVVKEANVDFFEIRKTWKSDADVIKHYMPFYERVKDECQDIVFFITICIQDAKYNFIGGAVA